MLSKIIPALAIAGAASARIVGLAAPKVIAVNETFTVTLLTENYIQSVKDLVAALSLSPRADADGFIGTEYLGSFYLGPGKQRESYVLDDHFGLISCRQIKCPYQHYLRGYRSSNECRPVPQRRSHLPLWRLERSHDDSVERADHIRR